MTETDLQQRVLRTLGGQPDIRLFRNQCGFGYVGQAISLEKGILTLASPRPVTFGLHVGSSDLIGWKQVVVTPEMVGRTLAVFLGVEVKTPDGREKQHQRNWREIVNRMGGLAIVARTDDAEKLNQEIRDLLT